MAAVCRQEDGRENDPRPTLTHTIVVGSEFPNHGVTAAEAWINTYIYYYIYILLYIYIIIYIYKHLMAPPWTCQDFGGDCGGNFLTGAGGFLQGKTRPAIRYEAVQFCSVISFSAGE